MSDCVQPVTWTGGKLAMKLLEGCASVLEAMGMTAGVAGGIMGCWCVRTAGIAIAIAGKLGTGGVGN